jgi:ribosome-binding factor A
MPDDIRIKRISAFIQQELSRIVMRELKNPIFHNKLISFPEVKVSKDLSNSTVLVSVFGADSELDEVVAALNKAEPLIRRLIMDVSELRRVPVFVFRADKTIANASKIDEILDSLQIPPEEPGEPEEPEEDA